MIAFTPPTQLGAAPRLIIVCGLPGSGKTCNAKQLEESVPAVRLCADEWMDAIGISLWNSEARQRIEKLQWRVAQRLLTVGCSVVIEWGTWARSERDALRTGARALGAAVELHFLDAPLEVLFKRIQMRNAETPAISFADIEEWDRIFQRPSSDEMALFDAPVSSPSA